MKKLSYLNHIDSLRALAVLLVVFFHLDITLFKSGFIGVDIFFVISGFLITRILFHEFSETGSVSFKNFYARRVRRLMPTLFLTIFLTLVVSFLAFSPSDFIKAVKSMFMSSIALGNFHFLGEAGYFDTTSSFKPLLHTWSLGIEEQFYLLYPLTLFLILKFFKKNRLKALISLVVLFSLSLFYTIYTAKYGVNEAVYSLFLSEETIKLETASIQFYLLPFRMFEFLIGCIIALVKVPSIKSEYLKLGLNLSGFILIIICAIIFEKNTHYMSVLNILPCIGAGMILFFPPSKHLSFVFNNKVVRYIAKISYTLYLMHWLVIVAYRYLYDGDFSILEQVGLFVVMLAISGFVYKYYENPLRYTKSKFSMKTNYSLVAVPVIVVLVTLLIKQDVVHDEGYLWRLNEQNLKLIEKIGTPKEYHKSNWGGAGYEAGWLNNPNPEGLKADVVLLGDSHAGHYLHGLHTELPNHNIYIPNWFSSLRLPGVIRSDKKSYIDASKINFERNLDFLKKNPTSVVMLSHYWASHMNHSEVLDTSSGDYSKIPKDIAGWELICKKIETFYKVSGNKNKFIIIGETPSTGSGELNYIEKLMRPKYLTSIVPTKSTFSNNSVKFNSYLENYFKDNKNIVFIDPTKAICRDGACLKQENDKIYYSDSNHLSLDGSVLVIKSIKEEILKEITIQKELKIVVNSDTNYLMNDKKTIPITLVRSSLIDVDELNPFGEKGVKKIISDTKKSQHRIDIKTKPLNGTYTFSVYAKKVENSYLRLRFGLEGYPILFDLEKGVITGRKKGVIPRIKKMDNGWYECSITYDCKGENVVRVNAFEGKSDAVYTGDAKRGVLIYGQKLLSSSIEY